MQVHNNFKTNICLAAAVAVSLMAGAAQAQNKRPDLDINKDGVVSMDEFTASWMVRAEKRFKKIDTNSDGVIDKNEMAAHRARMEKRKAKRKAG